MALGNTQALPQVPQLLTSTLVLTHTPPHRVWPGGHAACWQMPPTHALFGPHAKPHCPQLSGSVERFTQPPPQNVVPPWQNDWHCPAEHDWPGAQALPHVPQCWLSADVLVVRMSPALLTWPSITVSGDCSIAGACPGSSTTRLYVPGSTWEIANV